MDEKRVTKEEIVAAQTPKGGWTRATLAEWGVPWPPPRGWRYALENGEKVPKSSGLQEAERRRVWDLAICVATASCGSMEAAVKVSAAMRQAKRDDMQ